MTNSRSAKDLVIRPIPSKLARETIKRLHYSGKVTRNGQLNLGVYYDGKLEGAMIFGPSIDKGKMVRLVEGTEWNGFIELNRLAFSDNLPRNSESRALAIAMKLIRKHVPAVKWVVSFADGSQCGDGTIYRASGFVLTGIKESKSLARLPSGEVVHKMALDSSPTMKRAELGGRSCYDVSGGKYDFAAYVKASGATVLSGFQLRYVYFIDPTYRSRLTVPELPFSAISDAGAKMYKGKKPGNTPADGMTSPVTVDQAEEA